MDPFTMCLLIGAFLTLGGRSVANGVTDAIAVAKGKTPPSYEKWQKKQEARKARGEKPERKPGLARLWVRHAAETMATKAEAKQRGRREFLAEHGDKIAAKQKEKLERSAARRELVGQKLAKAADVSWSAAKDGAAKAKDKVTRNRAADEAAADKPGEERSSAAAAEPAAAPAVESEKDATVLPFRRTTPAETVESEEVVHPAPATGWTPVRGVTPSAETWGFDPDDLDDPELAANLRNIASKARRAGDNELADKLEKHANDVEALQKLRGTRETRCQWLARNPDVPKCRKQRLPGSPFCADHDTSTTEAPEPEPPPTDSGPGGDSDPPGPSVPFPYVHVPSEDDPSTSPSSENEGESMAPANTTTEITSLDTAIAFGEDSAKYTATVGSEMADAPALLKTFADGCEAEAKAYENASSQVEGAFSSDSKAKAQFAAAAEALNEAAKVLRDASKNVGDAAEKVTTANSAMKTLVKFFTDKLGTREVLNAEKANGGAAKTTGWYTD